jgi:P27 family predicted phage terminase small subunit
MPGGRPPKPVEQKERTGRAPGRDSGGRKLPETVVELPTADGVPDPPADLVTSDKAALCSFARTSPLDEDESGLDSPDAARWRPPPGEAPLPRCEICEADIGATAWRELWTQGKTWLSIQRDRHIIVRLCRAYVEEAHLRSALDEDGPFVKGQRGGLVAHPAVSMLRTLEVQITKWEGLCGFNPSDGGRLGIKVGKQRGASPLEEILARRAEARGRGAAAQRAARPKRSAGGN